MLEESTFLQVADGELHTQNETNAFLQGGSSTSESDPHLSRFEAAGSHKHEHPHITKNHIQEGISKLSAFKGSSKAASEEHTGTFAQ